MFKCTFEDGHSTTNLRHVTTTVVVLDKPGQKILLVKRGPNLTNPNMWALPGGYVDRDETVEQAAQREVLEETGYQITIKKLLRIIDNPARPKEDKQNIEFTYVGTAGDKVGAADKESSDVRWFDLKNVPPEEEWAFDHFQSFQQFRET